MNKAAEYVEKCTVNVGHMFEDRDPCQVHRTGSRYAAEIVIKTFKEQPVDLLAYNVNEVINYLKDNDLFDDAASVDKITH